MVSLSLSLSPPTFSLSLSFSLPPSSSPVPLSVPPSLSSLLSPFLSLPLLPHSPSPVPPLPPPSLSHLSPSLQDEWEALQVVQHKDALHKIEETLVEQKGLKPIYSDIPLTDPKRKKMF